MKFCECQVYETCPICRGEEEAEACFVCTKSEIEALLKELNTMWLPTELTSIVARMQRFVDEK